MPDILQNQTPGLESHLLLPPPSFREKERSPEKVGKSPTKCERKALTSLKSSLLTGLLPGSCQKVLTERERSKGQQAMKQQLFFIKYLLCAKPCTS